MKVDADKDKEEEKKNKKLVKLVEKYKAELNDTRSQTQDEINHLKAQLLEADTLQVQLNYFSLNNFFVYFA